MAEQAFIESETPKAQKTLGFIRESYDNKRYYILKHAGENGKVIHSLWLHDTDFAEWVSHERSFEGVLEIWCNGVLIGTLEHKEMCAYNDATHQETGTIQCPKCKKRYCKECAGMFLPIDTWVAINLMCPQCHYEVYESPKFAR